MQVLLFYPDGKRSSSGEANLPPGVPGGPPAPPPNAPPPAGNPPAAAANNGPQAVVMALQQPAGMPPAGAYCPLLGACLCPIGRAKRALKWESSVELPLQP